ncbi:hypothetical protein S83_047407, partial [Arachis hypogaea]
EVQHSAASKAEDTALCGAKITGRGSGGTVCVIGRNCLKSGEQIIEGKKHISTPVPHDSYFVLSVSSSRKYVEIVWPDIPYFSIYMASDWSIVDSRTARLLAWDTCRDRFAILESVIPPRLSVPPKGSLSKRATKAAAAQAAAAAAAVACSASVQVRILLDNGISNILMRYV